MLFLVHHAEAMDAAEDPQRPLTARGHAHAGQLAARAHERGVKPAVIWHSGKLRARQTAEHFWQLCNPLANFAAARGIQPGDPPEWIRDVLLGDERSIMLVGHMPHLGKLLALLVRRERADASLFPAHGLVALEQVTPERGGDGWQEAWRLED